MDCERQRGQLYIYLELADSRGRPEAGRAYRYVLFLPFIHLCDSLTEALTLTFVHICSL